MFCLQVLAFTPSFPPSDGPALLATTFAAGKSEPVYFIDLKAPALKTAVIEDE
jgi:hypothetical protein